MLGSGDGYYAKQPYFAHVVRTCVLATYQPPAFKMVFMWYAAKARAAAGRRVGAEELESAMVNQEPGSPKLRYLV